jgi:hypothetical protein
MDAKTRERAALEALVERWRSIAAIHGKSISPHTLSACADDLAALLAVSSSGAGEAQPDEPEPMPETEREYLHGLIQSFQAVTDPEEHPDLDERANAVLMPCDGAGRCVPLPSPAPRAEPPVGEVEKLLLDVQLALARIETVTADPSAEYRIARAHGLAGDGLKALAALRRVSASPASLGAPGTLTPEQLAAVTARGNVVTASAQPAGCMPNCIGCGQTFDPEELAVFCLACNPASAQPGPTREQIEALEVEESEDWHCDVVRLRAVLALYDAPAPDPQTGSAQEEQP